MLACKMQDAYIWGLVTRSSQRETIDESGMWSTKLGHLLHVFGSVSPGSSAWSQRHSGPLLLIQGLLSNELAADRGRQSGFSRSLVSGFCSAGDLLLF